MKRLLLVEDDADTREALKELLGTAFEVTLASNGARALACIETQQFEIILLDLMMPGLGGADTVRNLRARGIHTPILLCSGSPELRWVAKELELPFLQKPYWLLDLLPLLENLTAAAS